MNTTRPAELVVSGLAPVFSEPAESAMLTDNETTVRNLVELRSLGVRGEHRLYAGGNGDRIRHIGR